MSSQIGLLQLVICGVTILLLDNPRLGPFGYAVLSIRRVVVFILGVDKIGAPPRRAVNPLIATTYGNFGKKFILIKDLCLTLTIYIV